MATDEVDDAVMRELYEGNPEEVQKDVDGTQDSLAGDDDSEDQGDE